MFDIAINNGIIVDPEQEKSFKGSIGIKGEKILKITRRELKGRININAEGLIVSPGFIDVHGHIDGDDYCAELSLRQGITTTIGGNCGLSPVDMNSFFESQDKNGFIINQAELIGHSFSLRKAVGIKDVYAKANREQILKMEYLADKALSEGACGLSFGLDYAPNSSWEEILALSKVAKKYNKIIAIHTRVTSDYDIDSLKEVIEIGRTTGSELLISHFVYQYNQMMDEALEIVDNAIGEGLKIHIDSGMYKDWATSIGTATFSEDNIKNGVLSLDKMLVATGKYRGQRLDYKLYKELRETSPEECIIYFEENEESIYKALNKTYALPSTDTGPYKKGEGHPQIAGSFPKYFRCMVRERKQVSLIKAVKKSTLYPANIMNLKEKGRIKKGSDADLVVFDINTIEDTAEFPDRGTPDENPKGIKYVIVNGTIALKNGEVKYKNAGKPIRV